MEWESIVAGAGVVGMSGLVFKLAWGGLTKRRNGVSGLQAHNDSSTAHPDMRKKMTSMNEKIENIDDRTILMDDKLDRLLDGN